MSKQFVAWARVSSARQKKEGFSLEDQEQRLNDFAPRLGGSVVKLFKIAARAPGHCQGEQATLQDGSLELFNGLLVVWRETEVERGREIQEAEPLQVEAA